MKINIPVVKELRNLKLHEKDQLREITFWLTVICLLGALASYQMLPECKEIPQNNTLTYITPENFPQLQVCPKTEIIINNCTQPIGTTTTTMQRQDLKCDPCPTCIQKTCPIFIPNECDTGLDCIKSLKPSAENWAYQDGAYWMRKESRRCMNDPDLPKFKTGPGMGFNPTLYQDPDQSNGLICFKDNSNGKQSSIRFNQTVWTCQDQYLFKKKIYWLNESSQELKKKITTRASS